MQTVSIVLSFALVIINNTYCFILNNSNITVQHKPLICLHIEIIMLATNNSSWSLDLDRHTNDWVIAFERQVISSSALLMMKACLQTINHYDIKGETGRGLLTKTIVCTRERWNKGQNMVKYCHPEVPQYALMWSRRM